MSPLDGSLRLVTLPLTSQVTPSQVQQSTDLLQLRGDDEVDMLQEKDSNESRSSRLQEAWLVVENPNRLMINTVISTSKRRQLKGLSLLKKDGRGG